MEKFKFGATYLNNKLHSTNVKIKDDRYAVLVLVSMSKEHYKPRLYVPSGVNSKNGYFNVLQGHLEGNTYYLDKHNKLFVEVGNSKIMYMPYIISVPKDLPEMTPLLFERFLRDKKPIRVTKTFIEETKKLVPYDAVFEYYIPVTNKHTITFTNKSNFDQTRFECKVTTKDTKMFLSRSYMKYYFKEAFDMFIKYEDKRKLSAREYKTVTKHLDKIALKNETPQYLVPSLDDLISEYNSKIDKDTSNKINSLDMSKYISRAKLKNMLSLDSVNTVIYNNVTNINYLENCIGYEQTVVVMKDIFENIAKEYNKKYNTMFSSTDIAKQPLSYYKLEEVFKDIMMKELKK